MWSKVIICGILTKPVQKNWGKIIENYFIPFNNYQKRVF